MQDADEHPVLESQGSQDFEHRDDMLLLSWDSEEQMGFLENNPDQVSPASLAEFFAPVVAVATRDGSSQNRCSTCLDLDVAQYEDAGYDGHDSTRRTQLVRLFELRISARRGCGACLMMFNAITYFCMTDMDDWEGYKVDMALGTVFVNLRPGYPAVVDLYDYDHAYKEPFVSVELLSPNGTCLA